MRFRNSNIVFKKILNGEVGVDYEVATYGGIARKSIFYLLLVLAGAFGGLLLARVNPICMRSYFRYPFSLHLSLH